jgi:transcriptional regulator of heat shock response
MVSNVLEDNEMRDIVDVARFSELSKREKATIRTGMDDGREEEKTFSIVRENGGSEISPFKTVVCQSESRKELGWRKVTIIKDKGDNYAILSIPHVTFRRR